MNSHEAINEAERILLGSMVLCPDNIGTYVSGGLSSEHFSGRHRLIFDAIISAADHSPGEILPVADELIKSGVLPSVGGYEYINALILEIPSRPNWRYYFGKLRESVIRRAVIERAAALIKAAKNEALGLAEIQIASANLFELVSQKTNIHVFTPLNVAATTVISNAMETFENPKKGWGVPYGFTGLDNLTRGMHPGQLIVVAAPPGMGKSAFALNVAVHAGNTGYNVFYFSLEMSPEELVLRYVAASSGASISAVRSGQLSKVELTQLAMLEATDHPNILVSSSTAQTVTSIKAALKAETKQGPSLVVIDYLGLLEAEQKGVNRTQQVGEMTRRLKVLAMEFGLPIMLLSQLNRDYAKGKDKRPELHHLRDSGSIEQDADVVVFVYRPAYFKREKATHEEWEKQEKAELILAKQRNGPAGKILEVGFDPAKSEFFDFNGVANII